MGIKRPMKLVKNTEDNKNLKKVSDKEAEDAFRTILSWMGEDPNREGLLETPKRVIDSLNENIVSDTNYINNETRVQDRIRKGCN